MDATGARVAERWSDAFIGVQCLGAPAWARRRQVFAPGGRVRHRAVLWTQKRFLIVDQSVLRFLGIRRLDDRPTRLCPHESTSGVREALAVAVAAGDRCVSTDLDEALLLPRYSFPARRFVSIDATERQACAIDTSGAVECCGLGAGPAPPAPFSAVSAGTQQSCGVRPDHSWACWGPLGAPVLPPNALPSRVDQISTAGGWTCALGSDGAVTSLNDGRFVPAPVPLLGPFRRIRAGLGGCCALASDGALTCWNADHTDRRQTPLVDVGAPWATCRLVRRHALVPAHRQLQRPETGRSILERCAQQHLGVRRRQDVRHALVLGNRDWVVTRGEVLVHHRRPRQLLRSPGRRGDLLGLGLANPTSGSARALRGDRAGVGERGDRADTTNFCIDGVSMFVSPERSWRYLGAHDAG